MSRIGKLPVDVPENVAVKLEGLNFSVSGPKGQLSKKFAEDIAIELQGNKLIVRPLSDSNDTKALWGTTRSIINNMVKGVATGFVTELEITGVGYRASVKAPYLNLLLGKSHNTKINIPSNIKVDAAKQNLISLESADKEELGQFVALIIKQRPPEPYKGKGIKRKGQYIERKEGKKN